MKKMLIFFVLVSVVFGLYSEENLLWCKKLIFNEPTKYVIQKGDYFSKLSQQYYGTTDYWKELALVNRAPNKNLVFPGEEVIIPSLEAIQKVSKSRSLTDVNSIVKAQNDWIAQNGNITTRVAFEKASPGQLEKLTPSEETATLRQGRTTESPATGAITFNTKPLMEEEMEKSSVLPVILTIAAIALVVGSMSFYLYRRKKKYEMEAFEPLEKEDEMGMGNDEDADAVYTDPFLKNKREREAVLAS
jgi:LysM repeat protein